MPHGESKYGHRKTLRPRRKLSPPLPMTRPVTETDKPQTTISTSNILRRKPMKEVYGKKHSRRREARHGLFLDYKDQIEDSRTSLLHTSNTSLAHSHSTLTASLAALHIHSTSFHDSATAQREVLLAPITDERVETSFSRDGKCVKEVLQIGQRIDAFRAMLESKNAELELAWVEWEKVQARIVRLGVRVLGPGVVGGGGVEGEIGDGGGDGGGEGKGEGRMGYAERMRELDAEHKAWLEEMQEEIRIAGEEAVRMMQATEEELAETTKREQLNFIAQVLADE